MSFTQREKKAELVQQAFKSTCSKILQCKELPYNPYPELVKQLTQTGYRLEVTQSDISDRNLYFNQQVKPLGDSGISMTTTVPVLYGSQNIIGYIKVPAVEDYFELLQQIRPPEDFIQSDEDSYEFDCAVAVTGLSLFNGVLFNMTSCIVDIRLHYIAYLDKDTRESLFSFMSENIVLHLEYITSLTQSLFLGVTIEKGGSDPVFWTPEEIVDNSDRFMSKVKLAISSRDRVYTEMVIVTNQGVHYRARLLYSLTEVEEERDRRGDIITKVCRDYTLIPLQSVYDGVFLTQTDIETYAGAYLSSLIETDDEPIKIRRINQDIIAETVYDHWTYSLERLHLHTDFDSIIHQLLLCFLHKVGVKSQNRESILADLCKVMLRTKAGQLYHLKQERSHLRTILQDLKMVTDKILVKLVSRCVNECNKQHTSFLQTNQHYRGGQLASLLEKQLAILMKAFSLKHTEMITDTLLAIDGLFLPTSLAALAETLNQSPAIQTAWNVIQDRRLPDVTVPELMAGEKEIKYSADSKIREKMRVSSIPLLGMNKEKQTEAFISYCIDNHLYETWHELAADLDGGEVDPLKTAMDRFWEAAIQMEMSNITHADIHKQITKELGYSKVMVDPNLFIYRAGSEQAYGQRSALSNIHLPSLRQTINMAKDSQQQSLRVDGVLVETCISLGGLASQYGNIIGYMEKLELNEYWFIKSKGGGVENSIHTFSEAVLLSLHEMKIGRGRVSVYKLKVGDKEWLGGDVSEEKENIRSSLVKSMTSQEDISVTFYIECDWRYLKVKKTLLPVTIDNIKKEVYRFHPPSDLNAYSDVFLDQDSMKLFMSAQLMENNDTDPYSESRKSAVNRVLEGQVQQAYENGDYFAVMKALLIRSYISEGTTSSAPMESYKLFHSLAAELQFVIQLTKSLRDLFDMVMSSPEDHKVDLHLLSRHLTHNQRLLLSLTDPSRVPTTMIHPSVHRQVKVNLRSLLNLSAKEPKLLITMQSSKNLTEMVFILKAVQAECNQRAFDAVCPNSRVFIQSLK